MSKIFNIRAYFDALKGTADIRHAYVWGSVVMPHVAKRFETRFDGEGFTAFAKRIDAAQRTRRDIQTKINDAANLATALNAKYVWRAPRELMFVYRSMQRSEKTGELNFKPGIVYTKVDETYWYCEPTDFEKVDSICKAITSRCAYIAAVDSLNARIARKRFEKMLHDTAPELFEEYVKVHGCIWNPNWVEE